MEVPSAKLRKRDAVGNLRELADELGVPRIAKLQDLSEQAFFTFHGEVLAKAGTPKDRRRSDAALDLYKGFPAVQPTSL